MKKSNWIIFFVNGLIAILFGLLALFVPVSTIVTLTLYFGLVLIIGGAIMFYFSFKYMKAQKNYLLLMAEAILAIILGAIIVFYPQGISQKIRLFVF